MEVLKQILEEPHIICYSRKHSGDHVQMSLRVIKDNEE
jgi:hypothetical protein